MANLTDKKAINKWIFFTFNYPHRFIEQVWHDQPLLMAHIRSKFNGDVNKLYCDLDRKNRDKLLTYVLENYDDEPNYIEPCSED
jgi:hypothetical protein